MISVKKKKEKKWEKRGLGMEEWYLAKFHVHYGLMNHVLFPFYCKLVGGVVILNLFSLLKASTPKCFKWDFD